MEIIEQIKNKISFRELLPKLGIEVNKSNFIYSIYHQEKTPSCKIYFDENRYTDFSRSEGNGFKGGDIIQFYQDYYCIDTKAAIKELAAMAGLSEQRSEFRNQRTNVKPVNEIKAPRNFEECLTEIEKDIYFEALGKYSEIYPENYALRYAINDVRKERIHNNSQVFTELWHYCNLKGWGELALKYLTGERKIPAQGLEDFNIFYIKNYNEVSNHLKKVFKNDEMKLLKSGLFNEKLNLIFYQHRIIIPYIYQKSIVYLRGRYWDGTSAKVPAQTSKYLGLKNDGVGVNTPKRFFNIDILSKMYPGENIFITEGEFDAVIMESVLRRNCIAIPGVGNLPGPDQFKRLKDFQINLCIDNDEAGSSLLNNLKKIFFEMGKSITVKTLSTKDINEFAEVYG